LDDQINMKAGNPLQFSLSRLLAVVFIVAVFLALRARVEPSIASVRYIPPVIAALTSLIFASRFKSISPSVLTAAASGATATLVLSIDVLESGRRATNGEYFNWWRIDDLIVFSAPVLLHVLFQFALGATIGFVFVRLVRAYPWLCRGRPAPHAR